MKVYKRKINKRCRDLMGQNSTKDADGYMLAPPNRPDLFRQVLNKPSYDYVRGI